MTVTRETEAAVEARPGRLSMHGVHPQRTVHEAPLAPAIGVGNHPNYFYHGGPVINTPQLFLLFVGDWSSTANQSRATRLQQFTADLLSSRYMNILSQYGCGTSGSVVSSKVVATPDNNLTGADIQSILQKAIDNNVVPEPTNASLYMLYLDDATAVNDGDIQMCEPNNDSAFGFHSFFTTTAGNTCAFGVIPGLADTCLKNTCSDDGTCSLHLSQTREARQTQVTSHEIAEAISDPRINAWVDPASMLESENGDICNGNSGTITVGANTWTVQQMYSKWHDMHTGGGTTCLTEVDNPLPSLLPAGSIILDRSTFGKDEVDALLQLGNPAHVDAAFYVAIDGFTPAQLGITPASLIGAPNVFPNVILNPGVAGIGVTPTALVAEDPTLAGGIQRFTWTFSVDITSSGGFPSTVGGTTPVTLQATMSTVTPPTLNVSAGAVIDLIHEPNPYEVDGPISWLSTDLRVFQIEAGGSKFNASMGNTPADAPNFIQQVITNLNSGATGGQTFDNELSTDEQTSQLELSEKVNGAGVFNFAVAKVRYRALSSDAPNVRVFFRLFPVSTTSTTYEQSSAYRRGGQAGVEVPLLGIQGGAISTIPCFSAPRVDTSTQNLNAQTDPANVQTIVHDPTGNERGAFFGCWLDINQPSQPLFPLNPAPADGPWTSGRKTIQELIRNSHQCLVAEIAFDPDPIGAGATPGSSDKLAQRNLSIVASDNPGSPASHMIPNTFEVRPTSPFLQFGLPPDELLIDFTQLPSGAEARMFVPGEDATHVIEMADELYASHQLKLVDQHTISCPAEGLTYVPIPPRSGANLPGMLTVNLPSSVRKGQLFKVIVRQLTNAVGKRIPTPPPPPPIGSPVNGAALIEDVLRWRRVLGSYQISIPVRTKHAILPSEERLLAVLRWIQLSIPANDRWYAVFNAYVDEIAQRVKALGGDPDHIKPSPSGGPEEHEKPHELRLSGKVREVIFDRFGDFEGFLLDTFGEERLVTSHEPGIRGVVLEAARDRWLVDVYLDVGEHEDEDRIRRVVLRR